MRGRAVLGARLGSDRGGGHLESIRLARCRVNQLRGRETADRARAASSCISPRCPDGRLGPRGLPSSSTGWPPPGSRGGRCCRSGRPTATARRTSRARRLRPGRGCSPSRRAPVSAREIADFRERQRVLDRGLGAVRGPRRGRRPGALRARMGRAARATPPSAACGCSATSRSTSRPAASTIAPIRSCSRTGLVAGAPPDAFSATGQLWGNPLYDWPALRRRRYRWWVERLRRTLALFDLARIDHFRGFVAYWAVPAGARTGGRRALAARARARAVRRGRARARASCRWSPRTSA